MYKTEINVSKYQIEINLLFCLGISPFEMFAMATELHVLREKEKQYEATICTLKEEIKELKDKLSSDDQKPSFGVDEVIRREELKKLFKYYTGIVYIRFAGLLTLKCCHCKMDSF